MDWVVHLPEAMNHNEGVAAWAQAAGVVVALVGAVLVSEMEARRQRALADAARVQAVRDKLSALAGILQIAFNLIRDAKAFVDNPASPECDRFIRTKFEQAHFQRAGEILDRIPLHELPSADLAVSVHNAREAVLSAGRDLARFQRERLVNPAAPIDLTEPMKVAQGTRDVMEMAWLAAGGA